MNWGIRYPTTVTGTLTTAVVPYVKRERVGGRRRDAFIYPQMTIYTVITAGQV
jgi:hypothetical protein